ncbi:MAG TPA: hypothetical protein VF114_09505 [Candidatus Limnocylindria bacterium]
MATQRAENERTAAELEARVRHALDIRARFRENPLVFIGVGAAAVFLLVGGPGRVFRTIRRRTNPSRAEELYDALPSSMQAWVDTLISGTGPKAQQARDALVEELQRWRHEPIRDKKARKELAKAMVEGPPGPQRTAWKAAEVAAGLVSAALARKAIEAFITGDKPTFPSRSGGQPTQATATTPAAATSAKAGAKPASRTTDAGSGYSSLSSRS